MKTRLMKEMDWPDVARIFEQGIETGIATFEAAVPTSWADWISGRIAGCCIVCGGETEIYGWATLTSASTRCVYQGVAEVSIYVAKEHRRKGVGDLLLTDLIERAEQHNIWTLQAQMFTENRASISFHARHGFRLVGTREKIGKMTYGPHRDQWKDNVLMERRSGVVGI
jgi:phosphinothricin acetyltransferase